MVQWAKQKSCCWLPLIGEFRGCSPIGRLFFCSGCCSGSKPPRHCRHWHFIMQLRVPRKGKVRITCLFIVPCIPAFRHFHRKVIHQHAFLYSFPRLFQLIQQQRQFESLSQLAASNRSAHPAQPIPVPGLPTSTTKTPR